MTVVFRPLSASAVATRKVAERLGETLLAGGTGSKTQIYDGFLLRGVRVSNSTAIVTAIDVTQMIACPNPVRVPFGLGNSVSDSLLFPTALRDYWQPGYVPALVDPVLPELVDGDWRLTANVGFAFGGDGASWATPSVVQISANIPHVDVTGNTSQQHNNAGVPGFYNTNNPSLQRFVTRSWGTTVSASRTTVETGGETPVSRAHAAAVTFSTDYVDALSAGWVTTPRAAPTFTPTSPPGWANAAGVWGRSFRVSRESDDAVRYLVLARLFDTDVHGAADTPFFDPGAVFVATALVTPGAPTEGVLTSQQVFQTTAPSRFRNPDACAVSDGVHVLLHAEIVNNLVEPNAWDGGNTYTVAYARDTGGVPAVSFMSIDRFADTTSIRHFYGGASLDGVTSYFLYPYYNDVAPESATGLMRVLRCDGFTVTITDVATPAQLQAPGWGFVAATGLVSHIGAGKLGFVVTVAPVPSSGDPILAPFDVTFCTYDPATGGVEVRGQIAQATVAFVVGYPTAAGGIGTVSVVQEAVKDPDTDLLVSEAVLLWSTNSGSNPPNGGVSFVGATYVSYDSGYSWYQISDTVGDFRGVLFVGSALRPVKPGQAWVKRTAAAAI